MTFATPMLAAIAAAIAIPALIILYFLKLRRRDVEISTTLLWKKAIQDLQANAPFQKLRRNILLFLQLLALAIILFALAQPEFKDQALSNQRQVILIDRSASMQAGDGNQTPPDPDNPAAAATSTSSNTEAISRLEAAKKRALALVDQMKEPGLFQEKAEEAMVIAFDTSAEVRQAFTSNKSELRKAIEAIEPSDAPSGLERAITLAKAYGGTQKFEDQVQGRDTTAPGRGFVPSSPPTTIHLFSDGRLPDSDRIQTEATDNVVYHAVGSPAAANVGITSLRAERAFDNPGRISIFVGLESTARANRQVQVELVLDDTVVKVSELTVPAAVKAVTNDAAPAEGEPAPEERWTPGLGGTVYQIDRAEGAIARVRISPAVSTDEDALAADNIAYLVIPPARRLSVALVTTGNLFIKSALDGMNLSRLDEVSPSEFQKLLDGDQLAQYDVFIFDRVLPDVKVAAVAPPPPAAAAPGSGGSGSAPVTPVPPVTSTRRPGLPPGRSLVLGAVPSPPLGAVDEGPGERTFFAPGARDHPALRLAALDKVNIEKSRKVRILPDTPVRDIATLMTGQPGILEISDSTTLALVVPFDVTDSDWPFDPGWVLFLVSSTLYLADANVGAASGVGGAGLVGDSVRCGETLSTRLPTGARDARLTLPDNSRLDLEPGADGAIAYGPVGKTGIYTVTWDGQATASDVTVGGRARRAVAANLLNPDESDIGTRTNLPLAREIVQAQTQKEVELTRKLWPWLLLGALAMVMFEWWVYNRKVMI